VTDGRLTLSGTAGSFNNKIDFIDVTPYSGGATYLSIAAPAENASENGPTPRSFTITRAGGDLTKAITLSYLIGGSATNGVDYAAISGAIVMPANATSINVTVTPADDAIAEAVETVTMTLFATNDYGIGNTSAATIRINDNDTPVGNTISYATEAANPIIRAEALRAVVDGKLYVFGGFSGDLGPVKRSDVYDPAANAWTQLPDLPTRLTHAGVAVDGHDIYIAGGYAGIGATGYGQTFGVTQTWKFNTDTKQWTSFVPLPKAVAGGGLVLLGRELHWVGGNNNLRQDIGDHYILNLDNTAAGWKTSTPLPNGRSHLGVVVLNGKIYATGGQFGNDAGLTTQKYLDVWDPANPSVWTRLADMPTAISHIASATFVFGDRIVTMGGETAHGVATNLVYAYDPATDKWAAMTKLPAARFSGVGAAIDGFIYFTTGSSTTTTWKGTVS
jgi:N-acetylneuraminic acid mutarotase